MTLDDLTATMKTNFEGAVAVKAVQPHLPNMPNGGRWLNWDLVRPTVLITPLPRLPLHVGALAGSVCRAEGKRANILAPGYVDTDILADSPEKPATRAGSALQRGVPEDMAATVSFLVGPDSAYTRALFFTSTADFISPEASKLAGDHMVDEWDDDGSFESLADQPLPRST